MPVRYLTDKPLQVRPELIGTPLASPARRFVAFGIDYALLIIPTLVVAIAASMLSLWLRDPAGLRALVALVSSPSGDKGDEPERIRAVLPLLVRFDREGLPSEVTGAFDAGDIDRAVELVRKRNIAIVFSFGERHAPSGDGGILLRLDNFIPKALRAVVIFSVGAVYFTLMTMTGATLGKRFLGIRVVRLDGHHLTVIESLERFAGYLHIPGTLGLSLLDLWRDPNRRQGHDRVVHTAVIRVVKTKPVAKQTAPAKPARPHAG